MKQKLLQYLQNLEDKSGQIFAQEILKIPQKIKINKIQQLIDDCQDEEKFKKIQQCLIKNETKKKQQQQIFCILIINFHVQIGPIIEYIYPQEFKDENLLQKIPNYALPDLCHLQHEDFIFFNIQNNFKYESSQLYGVSCFKQITVSDQNLRNKVQKSICVITNNHNLTYIQEKCQMMTSLYFESGLTDYTVEVQFQVLNTLMQIQAEQSNRYIREVVQFFGDKLFLILKYILMEKNIMVFSHKPSNLSKVMITLLQLLPDNKNKMMKNRFFSSNYELKMYFSLQDLTSIQEDCKYLIGTTNALVKERFNYDLIIDVHSKTIQTRQNTSLVSSWEKEIQNKIISQPKASEFCYIGNNDWVRNEIISYFTNLYSDISLFHNSQCSLHDLSKYQLNFLDEWVYSQNFYYFIQNNKDTYLLSQSNDLQSSGTIIYKDSVYIGQVQNGTQNGVGVLINKQEIIEGLFINGKFMQDY